MVQSWYYLHLLYYIVRYCKVNFNFCREFVSSVSRWEYLVYSVKLKLHLTCCSCVAACSETKCFVIVLLRHHIFIFWLFYSVIFIISPTHFYISWSRILTLLCHHQAIFMCWIQCGFYVRKTILKLFWMLLFYYSFCCTILCIC